MTTQSGFFLAILALIAVVACVRFIRGLVVGRIGRVDRRSQPLAFALLMAAQPVGLLVMALLVWYRVLLPQHLV